MFDDDTYEVRQKALSIGDSYNVYEGSGDPEHILQAKQKTMKLKEDIRFRDPDSDEEVFRVTTDEILDIHSSYTIVDERTEEVVGALERESTGMFRQKWGMYDADGEKVAVVKEDSMLKAFARRQITGLIPIAFNIYDPSKNLSADGSADRDELASIDGQFSLRDQYEIEIHGDVDARLAVIGAVVIDAIENN